MLQAVVDGLTRGAAYALIALGYTMVYGILGMINFAHGEIFMIGTYVGILALGAISLLGPESIPVGVGLLAAFACAMLVCGSFGFTLERIAYRPLRQAHVLAPLISAIGISVFLQNFVMLAQGKDQKTFPDRFRKPFIQEQDRLRLFSRQALLVDFRSQNAGEFYSVRGPGGSVRLAPGEAPVIRLGREDRVDVTRWLWPHEKQGISPSQWELSGEKEDLLPRYTTVRFDAIATDFDPAEAKTDLIFTLVTRSIEGQERSRSVRVLLEPGGSRPVRISLSDLRAELDLGNVERIELGVSAPCSLAPESLKLETDPRVSVSLLQMIILSVGAGLMLLLECFVKYTRMGKAMRATSQDRRMAALVGIPVDRVISLTFVIGSTLAAAGGVLLSMYWSVSRFDVGYLAGLKAFTAAVVGGIGNIAGAMAGGFLLGLAEDVTSATIGPDWKEVIAFVILILVLIFKPRGILGERVSERI